MLILGRVEEKGKKPVININEKHTRFMWTFGFYKIFFLNGCQIGDKVKLEAWILLKPFGNEIELKL